MLKPYCILEKSKSIDFSVPLFESSDQTLEEIYNFRWKVYRKHLKKAEPGYVVTEFLPDVPWAGIYNTISCAAGHHLYEGRWIHEKQYLNDYENFWFTQRAEPRLYSFWIADAVYQRDCVLGDFTQSRNLYESLKENYFCWEKEKKAPNGLFFQTSDRDGMEYSISGDGFRPSINSYLFGELSALEKIAVLLGNIQDAALFRSEKQKLKTRIHQTLWNPSHGFFETVGTDGVSKNVRELIGYLPWYFHAADPDRVSAWQYLMDPQYFYGAYGPTSAERGHPEFRKEFDHECLWNGPSWPFATSQTLTALANLLNDQEQNVIHRRDYCNLLKIYANSQHLTENGKTVPFIDEDLDPDTGEWLARNILMSKTPKRDDAERGKDYNHSTYCDLILSGLVGVRPSEGLELTINPLADDSFDYFCADGILYHGKYLAVVWDKNGKRYSHGKGFHIFLNGNRVFQSPEIQKAIIQL